MFASRPGEGGISVFKSKRVAIPNLSQLLTNQSLPHSFAFPKRQLLYFQWITHSGGEGGIRWYGPGASLTDQTGRIPDTMSQWQAEQAGGTNYNAGPVMYVTESSTAAC